MWNGEVKVITGIRRCGKSVLLFDLFHEYLLSQGVQENHIIKIELDQRRYYKFRNPITLCEYVESLVAGKDTEKFYLFIDEVQLTTKVIDKEYGGIEVSIYDMLNELKAYQNLDVYVTGSNSKGLSKDIAKSIYFLCPLRNFTPIQEVMNEKLWKPICSTVVCHAC